MKASKIDEYISRINSMTIGKTHGVEDILWYCFDAYWWLAIGGNNVNNIYMTVIRHHLGALDQLYESL